MKTYTITVNGTSYEVTVEEGQGGAATTTNSAPKKAPVTPAKKAASNGAEGAIKINSPMPGKILSVKAGVGTSVKKGDVILLLEAMKMENEITATQDGTIASVVNAGDTVEAGDVLATLN